MLNGLVHVPCVQAPLFAPYAVLWGSTTLRHIYFHVHKEAYTLMCLWLDSLRTNLPTIMTRKAKHNSCAPTSNGPPPTPYTIGYHSYTAASGQKQIYITLWNTMLCEQQMKLLAQECESSQASYYILHMVSIRFLRNNALEFVKE